MSARCVVTARCHVEVRSWSTPTTGTAGNKICQEAYVKLNGTLMFYVPSAYEPTCNVVQGDPAITRGWNRGVNIHLIDPFACSMIEAQNFDTYPGEAAARALRDYLDGLDDFVVITGNMVDEAVKHLSPAHDALLRVGVNLTHLGKFGTFAFVTQKSTNENLLSRKSKDDSVNESPAKLSVMITGM